MNQPQMNHLSDEQVMDAYYGELDASGHLAVCEECRGRFDRLQEILDSFNQYPIPERDASYGGEAWTRLLPKLPPDPAPRWWLRWWILTPAVVALLTIAFVGGRLTESSKQERGISEKARERVLLICLSDHLEKSQIVLANIANGSPGATDLAEERDRARELLGANRLLRQTAVRLGDLTDAALLDELERVLLDIANSPNRASFFDLERIQQRIEQGGLLFRVRITSAASRRRGQLL